MSTRNYIKGFVEIPIKKFNHHYFINKKGDIIHLTDKNHLGYDIVYTKSDSTNFDPIKMYNYADKQVVHLIPVQMYMLTFVGYLPFKIKSKVQDGIVNYYYDIPSKTIVDANEIRLGDVVFKKSGLFGHGNIYVSEYGCIYDSMYNCIKPHKFKDEIYNYKMYSNYKIHQIVYDAWIGPLNTNLEIHHKDDNDWNNHYSNLVQLTKSEHMRIHNRNAYDDATIVKVCELMSSGVGIREAAEEVGVPYSLARDLHSNHARPDISSQYIFPKIINRGGTKTTDEDIHEICKLLVEHKLNNTEIGKIYDLNPYTIQDIRKGSSWKRIVDNYNFIRENDLNTAEKEKRLKDGNSNIDSYKASNQKITIDQVKDIWRRLQNNERLIMISNETGISYGIVKKIKYRTRWTHVTDQLGPLLGEIENENIVQN